jgi:hypothetical protein
MFRNLATTSSRTLRTIQARQFSVSATRNVGTDPADTTTNTNTEMDKEHAVDKAEKGDTKNAQVSNAKAGME